MRYIREGEILGFLEVAVPRQQQRQNPRVRLAGIRMPKLEQAPVGVLADRLPSARLMQRSVDRIEIDGTVMALEGLIALLPHHKDHGRQGQRIFFQDWIGAILGLPILYEGVFINCACRRPHLNALISVQRRMSTFKRTHRNQVHVDMLALRSRLELLYSPLQPALLLRAIGNTQFHILVAAGNRELIRQHVPLARPVISSAYATQNKKYDDELAGPRERGT